jgi:hypothetical protein
VNARATLIKQACDRAIMKWPAQDSTTYCNVAVNFIASQAGFTGFRGMVANDMVGLMSKSPDFAKVSPMAAQNLANDGRLVIAGIREDEHGHVACVYPGGELFYSKKWRTDCPIVGNVGKHNGVMSASWAFENDEPAYYAWIESV